MINLTPVFNIKIVASFLFIILIAFISGYIASTGQALLVVILSGVFIAFFLLSQPVFLFILTGVTTLLIAGAIKYFIPGFDRIWWVTYGMAALLYIPATLSLLKQSKQQVMQDKKLPVSIPLAFFLLVIFFSFLVSHPPLPQVIVAIKSIFLFGAVWAFLAFYPISSRVIKLWLMIMLVIALFQIFPVLYQYIFVRSERLASTFVAVEASDSVVGTFGGSKDSGGLTAMLGLYLVMVLIVILSFFRDKLLGKTHLMLFLPILVVPLLLIEVKAIFIFIPVGLLILYRKEIIRNPFKFFLWLVVLFLGLVVILVSYQTFHWSTTGKEFFENVQHAFLYSFQEQSEGFSAEAGAVTRRQAIEMWLFNYGTSVEMLIGHGLGSSRTMGAVLGEVARVFYPMKIDAVGISILLWELGVLGATAIILIFYFNYNNAGVLSQSQYLPLWQRSLARALQAIVVLFFMILFYRPDIPYAAPTMFLLMSCFGLISWLNSEERRIFSEKNP